MIDKINYTYSLEFTVRDYECDLQGIVNNACYFHYFEHARHQYFVKNGLDFALLHKQGIDPVLTRAELEYRYPLTSGNKFIVRLSVERKSRTRIVFHQDIIRMPDERPICKAMFEAVVLKQGKLLKNDVLMDSIPHNDTGKGEE
ncbi:MAG: acyl-CoA thioesterase [Spirochaetales bacterium]|nr:acyl-CoA thioesterase [Spirochaetales bacterium]